MNSEARQPRSRFQRGLLWTGLVGLLWAPESRAGSLNVTGGARYFGGFGLELVISDAAPTDVRDDSPLGQTRYRARFYARLNGLTMGDGDEFELLVAYSATGDPQFKILIDKSAGLRRLRLAARQDNGAFLETPPGSEVPLARGWHSVEVDWRAASSPGASDGALDVWVDGQSSPGLSGVDNDAGQVDFVRWGAAEGLDAATTGSFRLDEFESRGLTKIGLLSVFFDVPPTHPFWRFIQAIYNAEVTVGCGGGNYCPSNPVLRSHTAVFLLRSKEGGDFVPPPCLTPPFGDVPVSSFFCPWIQELANRGITAGCGGGNFCPSDPTLRWQMAVLLLRTEKGSGYVPPPCLNPPFLDVPVSSSFCPSVQELANRGVTSGCGGGNFCPTAGVSRGQAAVFLARTFALPVPVP